MSKIISPNAINKVYFISPEYHFKGGQEVPAKPHSTCQNRRFSLDKKDLLRPWLFRNTFETELQWYATADDNLVKGLIFGKEFACEIRETTRYQSWTKLLKGPYQRVVQIRKPSDSVGLSSPLFETLFALGYLSAKPNHVLKAAKTDGMRLPKTNLADYFAGSEKF